MAKNNVHPKRLEKQQEKEATSTCMETNFNNTPNKTTKFHYCLTDECNFF